MNNQIVCPSCNQSSDNGITYCKYCGYEFYNPQQIVNSVRAAVLPKIQVEVRTAITVDRTGSSKNFGTGIPKTAEIIFDQIAQKARSASYWVQSHGDLDENEAIVLLTDSGSAEQAARDIKKIVYDGGGDPEEHHLDAIENLLKIVPWPADKNRARGALIAFLTADSKPARSGRTARQIGEAIRKRDLLLYLVCEPTPQLQELVNAAHGLMFTITNDPEPKVMQKIAAQLAASIVASVSKGSTVPLSIS